MASQIDFYTTAAMTESTLVSVTSAATGYDGAYLVDGDYAGYWKPTTTADQTIIIDCHATVSVSTLYFSLVNYSVDLSNSGTATVVLHSSGDGTTYTQQASTALANPYNVARTGNGRSLYRAINLSTPVAGRYWKIEIKTMAVVIQIAELFLCYKHPAVVGQSIQESNVRTYRNLAHVSEGAYQYIHSDTLNATDTLTRSFEFELQSRWDTLYNVWLAARGDVTPVIMIEGTANVNERLVRLPATLQRVWPTYQYFKSDLTFAEELGLP